MPKDATQLFKLDLKSGYYHVPLHPRVRGSIVVCWEHQLWAMTSLPFGLSSAVELFQSLTNVPAAVLRRDTEVQQYIDDTCGVQPVSGTFPAVVGLLQELGLCQAGVHLTEKSHFRNTRRGTGCDECQHTSTQSSATVPRTSPSPERALASQVGSLPVGEV